jgi:hypothetical protein
MITQEKRAAYVFASGFLQSHAQRLVLSD